MAYQQNPRPALGATFIPGGFDDYYMPAPSPEVISPAPQRVMPEVPEQMQDHIARLELDSNPSPRQTHPGSHPNFSQPFQHGAPQNGYNQQPNEPQTHSTQYSTHPPRESSLHTQSQPTPNAPAPPSHDYRTMADVPDIPNFSAFPRLDNRSQQVPPSDEEKESILDSARIHVLNSNDPEMQLAWAQDTLAYVECAMSHEDRISATQPARAVTPAVEHQLRVDAMNVVNFLADQHHPKAEFLKGMWLEFGKFGLRVDKREAFRCYRRAADKGYHRAEYRIGMQFEQSNDAIKALVHYKRGSEMGDSASNYRLGMMTLLGQHSQPQDFVKGLQLIRQAAANADENAPQGAYVLGMLQARELPQIQIPEIHLPYSEKEARQNIERAAFLGFSKAQLKMGSAYELCTLGCEFSPKLSLHYNALAARQGELEADMAISKWFLCGYEGMFPKNEELAYVHAQRAAQGGLATAEFAMGYFHEIGMNVPVNIDKALEWYEISAKNGNKDAQGRIEGISKSGALSKEYHEEKAIEKIKSQYGSKRGQRPDRFKQKDLAPLQSVHEYSPSEYSQNSASTPTGFQRPIDRKSTTTPYPLEDPIKPKPAPFVRPATTAPYPDSQQHYPEQVHYPNPEIRPQSAAPMPGPQQNAAAFRFNTNVYPPDNRPPPGGRQPAMHVNTMPLRPATAMDGPGGRGRPPNNRVATAPQPGIYPGQRPGPNPLNKVNASEPPPNIGFVAPLEVEKPQRPQTASNDRVGPGRLTNPPNRMDSNVSPRPLNPASRKDTSTPQNKPSTRPGTSAGRPQNNSPAPQQKPAGPGTPKPQQQAQAPPPQPAAANKPPGKGPKTFDEMGVPKTKEDGDCTVM